MADMEAALKQLARGINTMPCRPLSSCHTAEEIDVWWMGFIQRQDKYVREVSSNGLASNCVDVPPAPVAWRYRVKGIPDALWRYVDHPELARRVIECPDEDEGGLLYEVEALAPAHGVLGTSNDQRKEARDGQGN